MATTNRSALKVKDIKGVISRWYKLLLGSWNQIAAAASLAGLAVFWLIPPLRQYTPLFAFVCANAIVWILIELKNELLRNPSPILCYANMRAARDVILSEIDAAVRARHRGNVSITMVGGRIRSMSDIVREAVTRMSDGTMPSRDVAFTVYCMNPAYLEALVLPGELDPQAQHLRNLSYASAVRSFKTELEHLVERPEHRHLGVTISVKFYSADPLLYCYVIGERSLIWGFFTWVRAESDFEGPDNPCFLLRASDDGYVETRSWIENRISLYDALAGARAAGDRVGRE